MYLLTSYFTSRVTFAFQSKTRQNLLLDSGYYYSIWIKRGPKRKRECVMLFVPGLLTVNNTILYTTFLMS